MPGVRLKFAAGEPIEFALEAVVDYGPAIGGFRAWLGAVFASEGGRWIIRFDDDAILGFRRDELKRVRLTDAGAELTLEEGGLERTLPVDASLVRSYGPEPEGVRAWLGRLAHGRGEGWVRLANGRELRFPLGDGPHVSIVG